MRERPAVSPFHNNPSVHFRTHWHMYQPSISRSFLHTSSLGHRKADCNTGYQHAHHRQRDFAAAIYVRHNRWRRLGPGWVPALMLPCLHCKWNPELAAQYGKHKERLKLGTLLCKS